MMRALKSLIEWIKRNIFGLTAKMYKPEFTNIYPDRIAEGRLYIVSEGNKPDTIIFKCPCGCNSDVHLNLLTDTRPVWHFHRTGHRKISISPSAWKKSGCKSHFFVKKNRIVWV